VEKRKKIVQVSDRRGYEGDVSGHKWNAATGACASYTEICETSTLETHI
jgi:hypothetical protein